MEAEVRVMGLEQGSLWKLKIRFSTKVSRRNAALPAS